MPTPGPAEPGLIVVILSGPSGAGKDALLARMRERGLPVAVPATMTTRAPRAGERNGEHHLFVTREQFLDHLAAGELLEHAEVYGHLYGVPRSQVRAALASGRHVVIRVDVQGAATLRQTIPGALFLFLVPDDAAHLEARLRTRGTEDEATLRRRLARAAAELAQARHFDHTITNPDGQLDAAVDAAWAIIDREAGRTDRPPVEV